MFEQDPDVWCSISGAKNFLSFHGLSNVVHTQMKAFDLNSCCQYTSACTSSLFRTP